MNQQSHSTRYKALALAFIASISNPGHLLAAHHRGTPANDAALTDSGTDDDADETRPAAQHNIQLVETGRSALAHVDAAAAALATEDSAQAFMELSDARKLLQRISIQTRQDLIPIFAHIGLTREYKLNKTVQTQLPSLIEVALRGDHEQVLEYLRASGAPLGFIHVSMPLGSTIEAVNNALQALHQERLREAQAAMEQIIDNLHTSSITVG